MLFNCLVLKPKRF